MEVQGKGDEVACFRTHQRQILNIFLSFTSRFVIHPSNVLINHGLSVRRVFSFQKCSLVETCLLLLISFRIYILVFGCLTALLAFSYTKENFSLTDTLAICFNSSRWPNILRPVPVRRRFLSYSVA